MTQVLANVANPRIERVTPSAAIPGGEIVIHGSGFGSANHSRPRVRFGEVNADVLFHADSYLIARVPDGASGGLRVATVIGESLPFNLSLGVQIADNLHPVTSPAVDREGNIYVTFSGRARAPRARFAVQSDFEFHGEAVRHAVDQSQRARSRSHRRALRFVQKRRHDLSRDARWPRGTFYRRHGNRHRNRFRSRRIIFSSAIAAARFSRSVLTNRYLFSPRLSLPSLFIISRSVRRESCTFAAPRTSSFDRVYRISPGGRGRNFLSRARPTSGFGV